MSDYASLLATIAGLQEQIDSMNGQLTEHRRLATHTPFAYLEGNFTKFVSDYEDNRTALTNDLDAFWLIFGGVLVFWMQAGFAMLEVGSVSKKNTKNILVKNIFDACIAAIMWWAVGSALANGADDYTADASNGFAGTTGFFRKFDAGKHGNRSAYAKASWFFGWTFAGAGCTIVSGAIAERATFLAYALYSVILTGFVYPPVVHMMWTSGKFSAWRSGDDARLFGDCGVIDFAGSGTVHMTGGVAALIAAACIGVRKGFPDALPEGQPVYQALGILILWMGWYGFNCVSTCVEIKIVSTLYIDGYAQSAAHVAMTTTLGAAAGCLGTAAIGFVEKQYIDPGYVYNGVLAGLVSITSPCAVVSPWGAILVSAIGALVYVGASKAVKAAGIDDAVDAFAVHGACGMWGVIACGLFATPFYYGVSYYSDRADDCAGVFFGGKASGSLAAAFACVFVILAWVGSTMGPLFGTLKATGLLRVSQEIEDAGLDDSKHGGAMSEVVSEVTIKATEA